MAIETKNENFHRFKKTKFCSKILIELVLILAKKSINFLWFCFKELIYATFSYFHFFFVKVNMLLRLVIDTGCKFALKHFFFF